jgi:hypothetical protein
VLGVVVVAGASSSGDDGARLDAAASVASAVTSDAPQNESLTLPASTQAGVEMGQHPPGVQKSTLASPVAMGSFGDDVKKVQERLIQLGFAPGSRRRVLRRAHAAGVWAYKKLVLTVSRDELSTARPRR